MFSTRRVRKVHLTAANEELIRRGALLLEDALHTASLPEAEGRLVVVKSLHVGTIRSDLSSASLALAIENRLRHVVPIHASEPGAQSREIVYFHDDAEPSILLALRLARREPTHAWFWRLAVPVWKPEMSLDEALRTIFFNIPYTKAGLGAAVRLVSQLHESRALDPLLTALRPTDGSALLRTFGWSMPQEFIPSNAAAEIPDGWETILTRWTPRWGQGDARTVWLAGMALAAQNPIRLLDADLMLRAVGVVKVIEKVDVRTLGTTPTPFDEEIAQASRRLAATEGNTDDVEIVRTVPQSDAQPDIEGPQKSEQRSEKISTSVEASSVGAHGGAPLSNDEFIIESSIAPWPYTPLETQHAGLFFLLPVLARLGIAEFLTSELIESMFPFHLLRFIGQRLGLPDDDPISAVLATDAPYHIQSNFVTPESWKNGIANPGEPILRRIDGKNVWFDASGRLVLAAGEGEMPETLQHFAISFGRSAIKISPDLLSQSWMTAARRWLRRNAQMGLADLILRPGRITATRTHIDLFFDLTQADIRVRRMGLDVDPGWVSWLGRVVNFHYGERTE